MNAQSGWTKEKGEYFAKIDISNLSANKYYSLSGTELITSNFNQTSINLYGEYGFKDRFTIITSMPLLRKILLRLLKQCMELEISKSK